MVRFYFFRLQPVELLKPFFICAIVNILTLEKLQNTQVKYLFSFITFISNYSFNKSTRSWTNYFINWNLDCDSFYIWCEYVLYTLLFSIFIISISSLLYFMPEKFGYIINRLATFIDPSKGDKFQSSSALDAIKLGGLKGQGMGEGILKESVPEAHTDYIIKFQKNMDQ